MYYLRIVNLKSVDVKLMTKGQLQLLRGSSLQVLDFGRNFRYKLRSKFLKGIIRSIRYFPFCAVYVSEFCTVQVEPM